MLAALMMLVDDGALGDGDALLMPYVFMSSLIHVVGSHAI